MTLVWLAPGDVDALWRQRRCDTVAEIIAKSHYCARESGPGVSGHLLTSWRTKADQRENFSRWTVFLRSPFKSAA